MATGKDLSVPASWRKNSTSLSRTQRITISQNAIKIFLPQLDADTSEFKDIEYWQSGNAWSAIINHDYFSGEKANQDRVIKNLENAFRINTNFDQFGYVIGMLISGRITGLTVVGSRYNDDALWWAQAAVYAYRTYNDPTLLSYAVETWDHISQYAIAATQPRSQSRSKNFQSADQCNGQTMVGGVFWRPTPDDTSINSITTGLFMTLSAYLLEITGNATYSDAAIASANWIRLHNLDSNGSVILNSINGDDCSRSPATWLVTYNGGKYIEGLAVLADFTKDIKWTNLMLKVIVASVKSTRWQGKDGIITEGSSPSRNNDVVGFKAIFIRGLFEAFARNSQLRALRILLHSYIDVQYNALLDFAQLGDAYSSSWLGPTQEFTAWGQLAALDVLVSAIRAN